MKQYVCRVYINYLTHTAAVYLEVSESSWHDFLWQAAPVWYFIQFSQCRCHIVGFMHWKIFKTANWKLHPWSLCHCHPALIVVWKHQWLQWLQRSSCMSDTNERVGLTPVSPDPPTLSAAQWWSDSRGRWRGRRWRTTIRSLRPTSAWARLPSASLYPAGIPRLTASDVTVVMHPRWFQFEMSSLSHQAPGERLPGAQRRGEEAAAPRAWYEIYLVTITLLIWLFVMSRWKWLSEEFYIPVPCFVN